jgi:phosphonate transport system substrate-binding protein
MRMRCLKLLAAAALLAIAHSPGPAQDWGSQYPELVFAAAPVENSTGVLGRYTPFTQYLARTLGTKVTIHIANDYAAVIEGQRSGHVHIAHYGPSSYARAWSVTSGGIDAFSTFVTADGSTGLYPVLYVRSESPANTIHDLKGKNLCLVDPNSTTGNEVPRYSMHKLGITPEQFFAKVFYAGSHENAIIGLKQGTCDGAFSWWGSDRDSSVVRMANKGMLKADEFRIIYRADIIPTPPIAYLSRLPQELKMAIQSAFVDASRNDKPAVNRLSDGQYLGFRAASHAEYEASIELQRFVDQLRRKRQ